MTDSLCGAPVNQPSGQVRAKYPPESFSDIFKRFILVAVNADLVGNVVDMSMLVVNVINFQKSCHVT